MKLKLSLLLLSLLAAISLTFAPRHAFAFDLFGTTCEGDTADSALCQERAKKRDPISGPQAIIPKIANIIAVIGGIIAIVIVMISGLKFVMSGGDTGKVNEARNSLIYAAVGLVVIAVSRLIIQFILRFI